jgi:hypothetical protein
MMIQALRAVHRDDLTGNVPGLIRRAVGHQVRVIDLLGHAGARQLAVILCSAISTVKQQENWMTAAFAER